MRLHRSTIAGVLAIAACSLAATVTAPAAEAQTYAPRLPCTAYNLTLHTPRIPAGQPAADSATIARHCGFEKVRWTDSVAAAKILKAAIAKARADSIARAVAINDSLVRIYPVDAKLGPCWRFNAPLAVVGIRERGGCFRAQLADGALPDSLLLQGALSTYQKGAWRNYQVADGRPSPLRAKDGTLTRTVSITAP